MTANRTRFDRRKKPKLIPVLATNFPIVPDKSAEPVAPDKPAPTHKLPTAPWRLLRPVSGHVLYRLGVAEKDAARQIEEHFDWVMAEMERQCANDNYPIDPADFE